jgi:hypothetical protein
LNPIEEEILAGMEDLPDNLGMKRSYLNRREVLRAGSLSLLGLGLPDLLRAREQSGKPRGKAKACIVLFMWGGPAHQDTWDLKPDAPSEYRGDVKSIATTIPSYRISEHLPLLSKRTDQLAIIRSMNHGDVNHVTAPHWLLTGKPSPKDGSPRQDDWPNYGAMLARLGRGKGPLPPFVSMMPVVPNGAPRFVESTHGQDAGWLGPLYNPMRIDSDASKRDYKVGDFDLRSEIDGGRALERRQLLAALDKQKSAMNEHPMMQSTQSHYHRAFDLLASPEVTKAFDLSKEPMAIRERYGMNIHGQSVLQARRLVEAGVPLVTVFWPNDGITNVSVYWDTHNRNFIDLKERLCPVTDKAFSALLDDLKARGMLEETLILWTGEMGRTPRVGQSVVGGAGAGKDGRDHWPHCFTSILTGGGIKGGVLHGTSDRYAAYPATNPVSPIDLGATIYHCLGIDPHRTITDRLNRPMTLCEGEIIDAIL